MSERGSKRKRQWIATAAFVLTALIWNGCGGKPTKTPEGTVRAYLAYMKAGKWKEAALLWDYTEYARRENPDWDSFGPSQRKLIIEKLAEEKAQSLAMWETYFTGDTKIETIEQSGERAHVVLQGRLTGLDLVKVEGEWRIAGMNY